MTLDKEMFVSQIVLWILVLFLTYTVLNSRTGHSEKKKGMLLHQGHGLSIGEKMPDICTKPILINNNDKHEHDNRLATVYLFTSATCPVCNELYPILSRYAEKNNVNINLFIQGDIDEIHEKIVANNLTIPVFQLEKHIILNFESP